MTVGKHTHRARQKPALEVADFEITDEMKRAAARNALRYLQENDHLVADETLMLRTFVKTLIEQQSYKALDRYQSAIFRNFPKYLDKLLGGLLSEPDSQINPFSISPDDAEICMHYKKIFAIYKEALLTLSPNPQNKVQR